MKDVSVSLNPPRDACAFIEKIDFRKGLGGWYFFCSLMILFGMMLLAAAALPPFEAGLIMFKLCAACMSLGAGILFLLRTVRTYRGRVRAFERGAVVKADVLSHERIFVPWKSSRDYAAVLGIPARGGVVKRTIRSSRDLSLYLPLDSQTPVLFDEASCGLFVPAEVDVTIIPS